MRRTLPLAALAAVLALGVGYGTSAATGPQPAEPVVTIDTSDRPVEPTARTYLVPPPTQPATGSAAPSSPAAPAPTVTREPVAAAPVVEAPVPAAVNPQPVPVADPAPSCLEGEQYDGERCVAVQRPEERIGSYRCPDPIAVVVAINPDGSVVCEVQP